MHLFRVLAAHNRLCVTLRYALLWCLNRKIPVRINLSGHNIVIRTGSPDLYVAHSCLDGEFRALAGAYDKNVKGLIIDAGGYIGTAALALSELYPDATIVTIEPSSQNFAILEQNIAGKANIHAEKAALVSSDTENNAVLRNRGTGEWGFTTIEQPLGRTADVIESVGTITYDAILRKYGFSEVLIYKMDIEGGEYNLLKNPYWMSSTGILMIELHDRIVSGCYKTFMEVCRGRYTYKAGKEKYVSVGQGYFRLPA
jgi:FkbM family methyltransferase